MSSSSSSLDGILDNFSKAHPFADTRAYDIFHARAKAAIQAEITKAQIDTVGQLMAMGNRYEADPHLSDVPFIIIEEPDIDHYIKALQRSNDGK